MYTRIEICPKYGFPDTTGIAIKSEIESLGIASVSEIRTAQVYVIDGNISKKDVETICQKLLSDPVTENYHVESHVQPPLCPPLAKGGIIGGVASDSQLKTHVVEVSRKPGVMDPVEATVLKGIQDLGLQVNSVKTARKYLITGDLTILQLNTISIKILANTTIENIYFIEEPFPPAKRSVIKAVGTRPGYIISTEEPPIYEKHTIKYAFNKIVVPLLDARDEELQEISLKGQLSLTVEEMKAIQAYFANIGRNPTDVELETIAQTWSEHCIHKTLKGIIEYDGKLIDNLLSSTIMKVTEELNKPWCVSVFKDNAGIIKFDEEYNVCFKVETHNHPSAIEPYGGANTGIGGVIRDILGTGLGAKPILNTDVFCFGPPDLSLDKIPDGALHPKRVFKGVVAGVRDYGNRMGIPTSNGAIFFDERYVGNPLVYCGTVGIIPKGCCQKEAKKGDAIVVVGGRTGRDGIHGATFSSVQLTKDSSALSSSAVQIGNAITEKKLTDVLLVARDKGLYDCITDCGAGGLSSAVGEMGKDLGAVVDLEKVPLKYEGLSYSEIWISEAQERMVLSVPPENLNELMELFGDEDVEATVIGTFTGNGKLHLRYDGQTVAELGMEFLHKGLPRLKRKALWSLPNYPESKLPKKENYGDDLKKILSSWNVCSKEWVIRQYDHEVQGSSVLKPLQGLNNDGPGDACIIAPVLGSKRGVIISNGMNPKYGDIDPYHMAASAIDEALRQIIAVGGNLEEVALLDNFCWGNTAKPECLGSLVRTALACYDVAKDYGTPFISGKDSLNNEFHVGDRVISIPPSLLISAIAVMPDITKAISMDAKEPGNLIYIVGLTRAELGGSHYYHIHGYTGNSVPKVDTKTGKMVMNALSKATSKGLVRACHDCSEGGLAVAAAEMSFAGGLGMNLQLSKVTIDGSISREDEILFSESNTRFIVEVRPECQKKFEKILYGVPYGLIGKVVKDKTFTIRGKNNKILISENISDLKEAWQGPLRW
ncbi:MAG TPA: phosphoribosylformylglycinamidine synthase subunit PurL [Candidatus Brocadiia bacterium]|nr:phosphoribosylformylglycinamidine synthase subunit PurL [Candidatus Brocadiales bacterium]